MNSENGIKSWNAYQARQGNYLIVMSNLPLKLDVQSHAKYSTISWRPIKDLLRNVINKNEDGTDIRPQEGNPGTVHVWPESDGQCGYAMATLQKREHAVRALHWLGGNSWYGRTLSVILYYDGSDGLQYIDSRWMSDSQRPIRLENIVSVSQKDLLQCYPTYETPRMLLCLVPKGSVFSTQRVPSSHDVRADNFSWMPLNMGWDKQHLGSQDGGWYPSDAISSEESYSYFPNSFQPTWSADHHEPTAWHAPMYRRPYGGTFLPPKMSKERRRRGHHTAKSTPRPVPDPTIVDKPQRTSKDNVLPATRASDSKPTTLPLGSRADKASSNHEDKSPGPIIADGSKSTLLWM